MEQSSSTIFRVFCMVEIVRLGISLTRSKQFAGTGQQSNT